MDQVESTSTAGTNVNEPKKVSAPDRVTFSKENSDKLDQWIFQITDSLGEFVKINKSDLINFLIASHSTELSRKELNGLKQTHYDEVKFTTWALAKIKEAKKNGQDLSIEDLLRTRNSKTRMQEGSPPDEIGKPKRTKRNRKNDISDSSEET